MPVHVQDDHGLAVLRDASIEPPASPAVPKDRVGALRPLARDGHVFFIDGEDPISLRLEILVDQRLPPATAAQYRPVGGTFLLHVPTGVLQVSGYAAWCSQQSPQTLVVSPGAYGLTVHALETRDLTALQAAEAELVGPSGITHRDRVNRLWFLGCLPTLAFILTLMVPPFRRFWPAALLLAGVSWLPHVVLVRGRRYRDIGARLRAYEAALPHYFLQLRPLESPQGLTGGWVTTE